MSSDALPERLSPEELFRQHAPFVARLLYRLGVAAVEVDDVVQQVFLVVHRDGGYVRGPATPKSYLGAIAVRAAASARRRYHLQRVRAGELSPDDLCSPGRDPVTLLETRQELLQLRAALDKLDPDARALLVLVELEGESCAAIAASQGVPVGTVYWRVHRARKAFHALVQQLQSSRGWRACPESQP